MVVAAQGGPVPAARKRSAKWNERHRDETRDPRTARVAAYLQTPTEQGLPHKGYRDMPATPLFAFGHGLSYTTFDYSNLTLSDTTVDIGGCIEIGVGRRERRRRNWRRGRPGVLQRHRDRPHATCPGVRRLPPHHRSPRSSPDGHLPGARRSASATSDSTVTLLIRRSQVRSLPGAL